jgi:hypothetical protein
MSNGDDFIRALLGGTPQPPKPPVTFTDLFRSTQPQPLIKIPKRKVFVSYHHKDQASIDYFRKIFSAAYDVFTDCSLDEAIDSNNLPYVHRTIAENFISGTSITIVICGTDTWRRKCVDWEIYSTLHRDHALLGIVLPHVQPVLRNGQQGRLIPDRLHTNVMSGYAYWIEWPQSAQVLTQAINHSIQRSKDYKHLKDNSMLRMTRNA